MTEKRLRYMRAFLVGSSEFVIDDNETHERLKRYDILDRLNELNDENKQLKSELGKLNILYKAKCKTEEQLIEMGKEVEKENEQLKYALNQRTTQCDKYYEENEQLKKQRYDLYMDIARLVEENEQLKQSIWKCRLCGNTGTIEHIAKRNGDVE